MMKQILNTSLRILIINLIHIFPVEANAQYHVEHWQIDSVSNRVHDRAEYVDSIDLKCKLIVVASKKDSTLVIYQEENENERKMLNTFTILLFDPNANEAIWYGFLLYEEKSQVHFEGRMHYTSNEFWLTALSPDTGTGQKCYKGTGITLINR